MVNSMSIEQESVRKMQFAGSWYKDDPSELQRELDFFFKKAEPIIKSYYATEKAYAIVVPHAGYIYSGAAAAHAYQVVKKQKVKRVILLGPSHYLAFHGVAISNNTAFETPLGKMELDRELAALLQEHPLIVKNEHAHQREHSLEMQLPFLKKIFPKAKLLPLIVGTLRNEIEIKELAVFLKKFLQEDDLIVVTSDFTHYGPRFHYTPFKDNLRENIRKLNRTAFQFLVQHDLAGFLEFQKTTRDTICGLYPLALLLALLPKEVKVALLNYYTSQEINHSDLEHTVSYLAMAFLIPNE